MIRWILALLMTGPAFCHAADELVVNLAKDLAMGGRAPVGWTLQSATERAAGDGALSTLQMAGESRWRIAGRHLLAEPVTGQHAVASYTVQPGGAGFYAIKDSSLKRGGQTPGTVELRVFVSRAGMPDAQQPAPVVRTCPDADEQFDFDTFLGYLDAGDSVHVSIGPDGPATGDATDVDYTLVRTPAIAVSAFPDDANQWSVLRDLAAGSLAERIVGWNTADAPKTLQLTPTADRESAIAFRMSHSGYYALHDASAKTSADVQANIYAGRHALPLRTVTIPAGSAASLNADIGYVEKGAVIYIAFANRAGSNAEVTFAGSIVEWAPRTPPLRVSRGADGYLDVHEPTNPRIAVDIPADRWVNVSAQAADATEAIRQAFDKAKSLQAGDFYAGVRLERGATYTVASDQAGGELFLLKDLRRIVFDGNGATLHVTSKEFPRRGIKFFTTTDSKQIVLADFTTTADSVPFATGEVTAVSAMQAGNQTVTFRLDPGSLDPVADIARNGQAAAYCYDAKIPGRLAVGTWSHYPGASAGEQPQLRSTDAKGVYQHTVTRTGNSIPVGSKWLVKNKGAGLAYLTTRGSSEDVTLWKVTGRASGGGLLYFWQTSRINILDCTFEPDGENWIGSSADAIHGRGREGVWVEDTTIRGICEDVMNTYGQTMVVIPDDNAADNVISFRMLIRPTGNGGQFRVGDVREENATVGDKLLFFNPRTGHVLGHAIVRDVQGGRFTLSNPIAGVDTWEPGDEKAATTVYNTTAAARFFVRDSHLMDSMRFAIYIKAQGGVIFNNTFDGFSAPAVFVANEPEWPEGPPGTNLWLQGNTFSQNNFGYMSRNRSFTVVDPAEVSVYTRHMRAPQDPTDYQGFITRGQYANSHMKIIGNTFHDWRGGGVAVRNARNVTVTDNLFLAPVEDSVMRETFRRDPVRKGAYTAIFFDSVNGATVKGNRFVGLPSGDHGLLVDQQVANVIAIDNASAPVDRNGLEVQLHFSEWFGDRSEDMATSGKNPAQLHGAAHRAGRLGAGLMFDGAQTRAVLPASPEVGGKALTQFTLAMWVRPAPVTASSQVLYSQTDANRGVVLAIDKGRFVAGLRQDEKGTWLDLGPATPGLWQHISLVFDGSASTVRGFVDGIEVAVAMQNVPPLLNATSADALFGGDAAEFRIGSQLVIPASQSAYHGMIDEFHLFSRALSSTDIANLALRLCANKP